MSPAPHNPRSHPKAFFICIKSCIAALRMHSIICVISHGAWAKQFDMANPWELYSRNPRLTCLRSGLFNSFCHPTISLLRWYMSLHSQRNADKNFKQWDTLCTFLVSSYWSLNWPPSASAGHWEVDSLSDVAKNKPRSSDLTSWDYFDGTNNNIQKH
jgi:hypothetical protein